MTVCRLYDQIVKCTVTLRTKGGNSPYIIQSDMPLHYIVDGKGDCIVYIRLHGVWSSLFCRTTCCSRHGTHGGGMRKVQARYSVSSLHLTLPGSSSIPRARGRSPGPGAAEAPPTPGRDVRPMGAQGAWIDEVTSCRAENGMC